MPSFLERRQRTSNAFKRSTITQPVLILQKQRRDEAIPLLYQLHWLPVRERIRYKAAVLVYKCLEQTAPVYLQDLITPYTPSRTLRSSQDSHLLQIKKIHRKAGERGFGHFGPLTWNNLPASLRSTSTLSGFKKNLKTYLFQTCYD